MPVKVGDKLKDRYQILAQIGTGGMGRVYYAKDLIPDQTPSVAIKEMVINQASNDLTSLGDQEGTVIHQVNLLSPEQQRILAEQFFLEAKTLYNLKHDHLPKVTDYWKNDDESFLVMDLIEGENLEDKLARHPGGLPVSQVLHWMGQVLSALNYCHGKGVIHRDIKPANIIIDPRQNAFLVDFGIAVSRNYSIKGIQSATTAGYSAPEQYGQGMAVDERTDIYAFGATLYHLLTGKLPRSSFDRSELGVELEPPRAINPVIPRHVEKAILRAMELDRDDRFPNVSELIRVLTGQSGDFSSQRKIGYATANTPALVIFLMDISVSMDNHKCGSLTRREVAQAAFKSVIQRMLTRSIRSSNIAPRYRIALLAYGSGVTDLFEGVHTIAEIAKSKLPENWPQEESTDTALGFCEARKILEKEISLMKPGYPAPIIVHITDGDYTTDDPTPVVQQIMNLDTPGGKVLIENIFINDDYGPEVDVRQWKGITNISEIKNVYARNLFGLSSIIPSEYLITMREWGFNLDPQARLLFPGSQREIIELGFITAAATPLQPQ